MGMGQNEKRKINIYSCILNTSHCISRRLLSIRILLMAEMGTWVAGFAFKIWLGFDSCFFCLKTLTWLVAWNPHTPPTFSGAKSLFLMGTKTWGLGYKTWYQRPRLACLLACPPTCLPIPIKILLKLLTGLFLCTALSFLYLTCEFIVRWKLDAHVFKFDLKIIIRRTSGDHFSSSLAHTALLRKYISGRPQQELDSLKPICSKSASRRGWSFRSLPVVKDWIDPK